MSHLGWYYKYFDSGHSINETIADIFLIHFAWKNKNRSITDTVSIVFCDMKKCIFDHREYFGRSLLSRW